MLLSPSSVHCSSCGSAHLNVVPCCGLGTVVTARCVISDLKEPGAGDSATIAIVALDEGP